VTADPTTHDHEGAPVSLFTVHSRAGESALRFYREFAAPASLVFLAHTDVDLFVRWMGPSGTRCEIDEFDARTGGRFRYVVVGSRARSTVFGSYHEVAAPDRIVHTWESEEDGGGPTLEILTFVDIPGGHSRLEGLSVFTSAEQCVTMLDSDEPGGGTDENFERLDAVLAELC
jgi:uncharacterized protein YndB with AHSA1/START domain